MRTEVLTADGNRALGRLGGGKTSSGGRAKAETGFLKSQEGGEKAVLLGKVLRPPSQPFQMSCGLLLTITKRWDEQLHF